MLFTIATVLWIIALAISISKHNKKEQQPQQPPQSYPTQALLHRKNVTHEWIKNYIRDNGNKVKLSQLKKDFNAYMEHKLASIVMDMVELGAISHGIDTDTFEEYVELVSRSDKHEW